MNGEAASTGVAAHERLRLVVAVCGVGSVVVPLLGEWAGSRLQQTYVTLKRGVAISDGGWTASVVLALFALLLSWLARGLARDAAEESAPAARADLKPGRYAALHRVGFVCALVMLAGRMTYDLIGPIVGHSSKRAFVSRARSDMRTLTSAIESYFVEHNAYPLRLDREGVLPKPVHSPPWRDFSDPFAAEKGTLFRYQSMTSADGTPGWIVWSGGPDLDLDITPENLASLYDPAARTPSYALIGRTYDPTNGSESDGDVYRLKQ